ncbi:amidohydrolase [Candidatus Bathyarchaeota archaeon]|nr:amidohydrolase [Candidatus Bathyarchaeota archaeon]
MVTMSADLALIGGKILTMNPSQPYAEAIAIRKDRIVKVGASEEITQLIGKSTKVIRLNGKTVVPGFIDTHIHVADFGRFLTWVDLRDVQSIKEMQSSIKERVRRTPTGKWIIGRGWDQNCFAEKRLPTRYDLDAASLDNPVILYHQSGQMCIVNSRALELAGVTKQTSAPQGGTVDKNEDTDELTGILRDAATNLVWNMVPEPSEEELVEAAGLACEKIVEAGVTGVHWMVLSSIEVSIIQKLRAQNRLPLRVYMIIPVNLLDNVIGSTSRKDFVDNALKVGGAVIFADGYLAARTAALFQPYSDCPDSSGRLLCTQEEMNALTNKILKMGLQLVIHAMGDKAVDAALTAIEQTSKEAPRKDARNRIEHAAVLNEELINRMKKQKVIVSVQPCVVASEFSVWSATEHLGPKRDRWLFPIKTLLKEGIRVVSGSDCPMEPLSPLLGIQAAVTREFFPEERITVDEALRMYMVDAAYSSGEENIKGSVETGKLADLTILSHNPRKVPPSEIENITVEMTIVGGRVVYSKH